MREFLKGVCILVILAGAIAATLAWVDDRPSQLTWLFRVSSPLATLVGFVASS